MSYVPLFRWSGEYVGFICNRNIFDSESNYLGWVENDDSVWSRNGNFVGQLIDDHYILKYTMRIDPIPRIPHIPPIPPIPPIPSIDRIGRIGKISWRDSFDDLLLG